MARTRRKRLCVRQSLAYREGKSNDGSWWVGYWDRIPTNADDAFRAITKRATPSEAQEAAKELARKRNKEYIYG